jgi:hypothetical protein
MKRRPARRHEVSDTKLILDNLTLPGFEYGPLPAPQQPFVEQATRVRPESPGGDTSHQAGQEDLNTANEVTTAVGLGPLITMCKSESREKAP